LLRFHILLIVLLVSRGPSSRRNQIIWRELSLKIIVGVCNSTFPFSCFIINLHESMFEKARWQNDCGDQSTNSFSSELTQYCS
jgi:uncharacterized membrane protein